MIWNGVTDQAKGEKENEVPFKGLVCSFHCALLKGFGLRLWALRGLRGVKFSCQLDWLLWPQMWAGFVTTVCVQKCFLEAITPGKRWFLSLPLWESFTSFYCTQLLAKKILQCLGASWRPHKAHCLGFYLRLEPLQKLKENTKLGSDAESLWQILEWWRYQGDRRIRGVFLKPLDQTSVFE